MNNRYSVERIMEIIAFVIATEHSGAAANDTMISELQQKGYTEPEIAAALSWIIERKHHVAEEATVPAPSNNTAFRVLNSIEQDIVTPEAWGQLMVYKELGFISNKDLENILERAMMMGIEGGLGAEEVKMIVAVYFFNEYTQGESGSRTLLFGTDSVN